MVGDVFLDLDRIAQPIPGDRAAGPDLRENYEPDAIYRRVKDARQRAGRAERNAWAEDAGSASADWSVVLSAAPEILYEHSKDLEVAAWLTEALLREHGFAGLRDGLRACTVLVENFWDDLHPNPQPDEEIDEDEGLIRVAALAGLNGGESDGTLIGPIFSVNLVETFETGSWGLSSFQQAAAIDMISDPDERAKRLEHGAVTMDLFNQAARSTAPTFFHGLKQQILEAQQWFDKLCAAIEARCSPALCPPSSNIRNALTECLQRVQAFINEFAPEPGAAAPAAEARSDARPANPGVSGPIQSREQAFAVIREAAAYFRATEPHSVLSWQLDECVKWGAMSLPDLLKELISDSSALEQVYKRVGIPPPKDES